MPDSVDDRIVSVLETAPVVEIPADFAARMAGLTAAEGRRTAPRVGWWSIRVGIAGLAVAMLLCVPAAMARTAVPLGLELLFTAEFVGLVVWTSLRA